MKIYYMDNLSVVELLEKIGLSKQEATVYLALARMGNGTASDIAGSSGVHRPNVYDALKRLEANSLVAAFKKDNKLVHTTTGFDALRGFVSEKIDYAEKLQQELTASSQNAQECEVSVFSGKRAIRVFVNNVIETLGKYGGESLCVSVDERKFFGHDDMAMNLLFSRMRENKWHERVIVAEGDDYLPAPEDTTTYATMPRKYLDSSTSFVVFGDRVAIVVFTEPVHVVMIRSRKTADSYRKKFYFLWKNAKKIRQKKKGL